MCYVKVNELYVLQKRALKHILNVHYQYPTEKLFCLDFKSLPYIIDEQILILIYKIVQNLIKNNYTPIQLNTIHSYETRRRSHYDVEFFHTELGRQNVYYKGFLNFNKLPSDIRQINTLKEFKYKLTEYINITKKICLSGV